MGPIEEVLEEITHDIDSEFSGGCNAKNLRSLLNELHEVLDKDDKS
jgi:hypothetical protein